MPPKGMPDLRTSQKVRLRSKPKANKANNGEECLNLYILHIEKSILEQSKCMIDKKKRHLEEGLWRVQREIKEKIEKEGNISREEREERGIEIIEKKGPSKPLKTMSIDY